MKNGIPKAKFPTVVAPAKILAEALRGVPNCVELAGDVMGFLHRVATGFTELSEQMEPHLL